ncbi:MAG: PQQ-dependent sugar dehydrogenase [Aggregatilineales bacterium]
MTLFSLIPLTAQDDVFTDDLTGTQYMVERYVPANFPVGMVFLPDGRLLYNEKTTGNVRLVNADGTSQLDPVLNLNTDALQERGMLGITIDPDFENNNLVYVVHTAIGTARDWPANRLVRFELLEDGTGSDPEELIRVPIDNGFLLHNGGNVHFDDAGYLYITFGDYGDAANAQDVSTPQGAIHRFIVTADGLEIPDDNPIAPDNSIYAYGFRNLFDFTFDPEFGHIFGAEVGPSCDDEINLVLPGFNYGWNENYECSGTDFIAGLEGIYAPPLLSFNPVEAPTGILVYDGDAFPEWQGNLLLCNWNFGNLRRIVLNDNHTRVEEVHEIDLGNTQCRLDLTTDAAGNIYFGTVGDGDGSIMRLVPAE